jgi:hypothetical protein
VSQTKLKQPLALNQAPRGFARNWQENAYEPHVMTPRATARGDTEMDLDVVVLEVGQMHTAIQPSLKRTQAGRFI